MENDVTMAVVDGFEVPENEASDFAADRDFCEAVIRRTMQPYCHHIVRQTLDQAEGEGIFGYLKGGAMMFEVLLDPFEVPVLKTAHARGKLKEYIMAANDLNEDVLERAARGEYDGLK